MSKIANALGSRRSWAWPYVLFLVLFVVLPLLLIGYYAFIDNTGKFTLMNFTQFFQDSDTLSVFFNSLFIALLTTVVCLLLGYPAAYIMAKAEFKTPQVMAVLFILPMWINLLLRTMATAEIFRFLNLPMGSGALVFGLVYDFLPFMIYPIYNTLQKMDNSLIEAAEDLGANRREVFTKVILPLSKPGIYSGIVMVFMPTVSTFAIAEILTWGKIRLFGTIIQQNTIGDGGTVMWNYGVAMSLILLVIIGLTSFFGQKDEDVDTKGGLL